MAKSALLHWVRWQHKAIRVKTGEYREPDLPVVWRRGDGWWEAFDTASGESIAFTTRSRLDASRVMFYRSLAHSIYKMPLAATSALLRAGRSHRS